MDEESLKKLLSEEGFTVIDKVGSGSFADVYKVSWRNYPDLHFAAKVFRKDKCPEKEIYTTYIKEVMSLKRLDNPNIINFYRFFHIDGMYALIFEYCNNGCLHEKIKEQGNYKEADFIPIARECILALQTCHQQNIAHRDIKPSNILVDEHNHIKLSDFGLAHRIRDGEKARNFCGTLGFLAPEILLNLPYDPIKADIWALGITFCTMLENDFPFDISSKQNLIDSICHEPPNLPKTASHKLKDILSRMLAFKPWERPTASDLLENDLFRFVLKRSSESLPPLNAINLGTKSLSNFIVTTPLNLSYHNRNTSKFIRSRIRRYTE